MLGSLIVGSLFLVSQQAQAAMVIQVADANNFCTFLPPTDSTDRLIADSETEADAFCMGSTPKATGADSIPSGFIQSAHFVATDDYVQVCYSRLLLRVNIILIVNGRFLLPCLI